jgi:transcriptional regulator with XRE-family HTH domain
MFKLWKPRCRRKLKANEIDKIIGSNIKLYREEAKITQTELGKEVGLSYQQIQKYERGANKVSAVTLWGISKMVKKRIELFFEKKRME